MYDWIFYSATSKKNTKIIHDSDEKKSLNEYAEIMKKSFRGILIELLIHLSAENLPKQRESLW